jgi:hypothetical protein
LFSQKLSIKLFWQFSFHFFHISRGVTEIFETQNSTQSYTRHFSAKQCKILFSDDFLAKMNHENVQVTWHLTFRPNYINFWQDRTSNHIICYKANVFVPQSTENFMQFASWFFLMSVYNSSIMPIYTYYITYYYTLSTSSWSHFVGLIKPTLLKVFEEHLYIISIFISQKPLNLGLSHLNCYWWGQSSSNQHAPFPCKGIVSESNIKLPLVSLN